MKKTEDLRVYSGSESSTALQSYDRKAADFNSTKKREVPENYDAPRRKRKTVGIIILIVVIVALVGAAGFFGYRYFTEKASMEILSKMTGTWIYDTGSADAGYVEFRGNKEMCINGEEYTINADKKKLTLQNEEKGTVSVEYILNGEQLMLALGVENVLFESCNVTVSPSDVAGVLLYRISESYGLEAEIIQEAYLDRFPEYIEIGDELLEWIFGSDGQFDFGILSDFLADAEGSEDIEGILGDFLNEYAEGSASEEFDASDFINDYISGSLEGWGDELGDYIAGEIDGTETENFLEGIYDAWNLYESIEEGDYSDVFDYFGDLWGW